MEKGSFGGNTIPKAGSKNYPTLKKWMITGLELNVRLFRPCVNCSENTIFPNKRS